MADVALQDHSVGVWFEGHVKRSALNPAVDPELLDRAMGNVILDKNEIQYQTNSNGRRN